MDFGGKRKLAPGISCVVLIAGRGHDAREARWLSATRTLHGDSRTGTGLKRQSPDSQLPARRAEKIRDHFVPMAGVVIECAV